MTERYGCGGGCANRGSEEIPADKLAELVVQLADPDSHVNAVQPLLAYHEAGHCLMCAFAGYSIRFVQVGLDPRTACHEPTESERAYFASLGEMVPFVHTLMNCMAGDVAAGVARRRFDGPTEKQMQFFLEKARRDECGSCDQCLLARMIGKLGDDDAEKMHQWARLFRTTVELFDSREWRVQLRRVALALLEKKRLEGDDVHKLIDVDELRRSAATAGGVSHSPPPAESGESDPFSDTGQRADDAAALPRPPSARSSTDRAPVVSMTPECAP